MSTYLDHAASTAVRPECLVELQSQLSTLGNPSSVHVAGQRSRAALAQARERLATALGAHPSEVIFVSGGTEANNLAIKGLFHARVGTKIILVPQSEHHAVLDAVHHLADSQGAEVHYIPQNAAGQFDLPWVAHFLSAKQSEVALVTAMWVNNETGVINDVPQLARLCAESGVPFHTDAVAAAGHLAIDFASCGASTLAISGHKFGAPIGVGALLVDRKVQLASQIHGGGQERDLRAGTVSYPLASTLATAMELASQHLEANTAQWFALAEHLFTGLNQLVSDWALTAQGSPRVPSILNLTFEGLQGDSLLFLLDQAGVCVSNGSACTAGVVSASHVLLALDMPQRQAASAIRVSFGESTTREDIDALLAALPSAVAQARRAGYTLEQVG